MATEIRVPTLGESITEATVGKWFKKAGDAIKADAPLVALETANIGSDEMATEIRVPTRGESITEATVGKWFKKAGDAIKADEPLVELETDKVTLEVNAPASGVLAEIAVQTGETVAVGALLVWVGGAAPKATAPAAAPKDVNGVAPKDVNGVAPAKAP